MRFAILLVVVCALLGGVTAYVYFHTHPRPRRVRSEVVLKDEYERAAAQNYRLLQRSGRALQSVLDEDAVIPWLKSEQRQELEAILSQINK